MSECPQRFYEFDAFLLDAQERLLFLDGEPLDLTPKVFDILLELVRHSGRLVEKKELMESVWPDSFVEENNLTQHISTLRKKLAQHSDRQRYILTVPGRGYRFVASVRGWDDDGIVTVHERIRARVVSAETTGDDERREEQLLSAGVGAAERLGENPETRPARAQILPGSSSGAHKRNRVLVLAAAAAVLLLLAFGLYRFFNRKEAMPFERTKLAKFTTGGKVSCAAISPDGKYVAYGVNDGGQGSLWVRQTVTSNDGVQVIPSGEFHCLGLSFSPDSNYLYYLRSTLNAPTLLYRVAVLGGTPAKLLDDVDSAPTFSPDGKQMAYLRGYPDQLATSLMVANVDGSGERTLVSLKAPGESFTLLAAPSWSPDGKRIACSVSKAGREGEYQELYEVGLDGGVVRPVTSSRWQEVGPAAWLGDGRGLLMVAADQESALAQIWYVSYPGGELRKVTNDLSDYSDLSVAGDGQSLVVLQSDRQSNIWLVPEADAGRAVQVTSSNYDGADGITWTPDGRLLYTTSNGAAVNLRITDTDGQHQKLLTEGNGFNRAAAVSPDGSTIAFALMRNNEQHLWLIDADGGRPRLLTNGVRDGSPVFSVDGRWVIYKSYVFGNPNLFKVRVEGGQPVRLTERISGPPTLSPDGKTIACTYREDALAPVKIALFSVDGGPPLKLIEVMPLPSGGLLHWTRDGQALAYLSIRGGFSNIWLQPLDGGPPHPLTEFRQERIFWFDFSPDGRTLAVARGRISKDVILINAVN